MQDQAPELRQPDQPAVPLSGINAGTASPQDYQATPSFDTFYRSPKADRADQIARMLGWFSIGIGLAQLLAPRGVSRTIGVQDSPKLMRTLGAREIASGIGILSQRRPANWLWTRVAGDAIDLALLGAAARSPGSVRNRIGLATAALAGIAALDLLSSIDNTQRKQMGQGPTITGEVKLEKSITVNLSPEECYRFWHDFASFPRFMKHLESVEITGGNRMHWKAKAPVGSSVEWDAELVADEPGRLLAWRSLPGSQVDNEGVVRFEPAPDGRGTILRVMMRYTPPGGIAGALVAKMFGEEPSQQIDEDLRRFKWLIETGEIPTTVGQSAGERSTAARLLFRKGQPG
ncbi:SRPBCC family protein [Noviherbaspirillum denitrificans]|uniref:Cyclase/dehydrase n=1 Tax=Noviherbaspirillum denitrificans TaxID=1968433 RepID=A0A254TQR6_9BURK|nr:SRPBCC family protein [Noviherbaspirillum denitrificans]OWW22078.1 cyclase/dehydrase [Noviherbaspirillum denitrificans]